jgi:Mg-chelatase subunit ChlD
LNGNIADIALAMDRLRTTVWNGNTYIESGMRTGLAALQDPQNARSSAEKIMILLTDGLENEGSAMRAAADCAAADVVVHTITFANSANQATMRDVAALCQGSHHHASDEATLRQIFRALAAQTARLTE